MASYSNMEAYDPTKIEAFCNTYDRAYGDLVQAMGSTMQTQVLDKLQASWSGTQARTYLPSNVNDWKSICKEAHEQFTISMEDINGAASDMAQANGETWGRFTSGQTQAQVEVDVQEEINGARGIVNVDEYSQAVINLQGSVLNDANTSLASMLAAVKDTGFLDSSTEDTIISGINSLKDEIQQFVEDIINLLKTNGDVNKENLERAIEANASRAYKK